MPGRSFHDKQRIMLNLMPNTLMVMSLLVAAPALASESVRIENDHYLVSVDAADGRFTIVSRPLGKLILSDGILSGKGGAVRVIDQADKAFGKGKPSRLPIPRATASRLLCTRAHRLFCSVERCQTAQCEADRPEPRSHGFLRRGPGHSTGGNSHPGNRRLAGTARNPGSYAFLAVVDPQTRNGVVAGWLTHDRGSGGVSRRSTRDTVRSQAPDRLRPAAAQARPGCATETLALGYFDDARLGLEAYADAIAKAYAIHLLRRSIRVTAPGTWKSSADACDEKHLVELSDYAARYLKPFGFDFIQIDDGWQAGIEERPEKNFTTHRPDGPYPCGMKATAENIKQLGLTPGIWFMPFAGKHQDPHFKDHQDRFAKNPAGKPYETDWGGTCLDMTTRRMTTAERRSADRSRMGIQGLQDGWLLDRKGHPADVRQRRLRDDEIGEARSRNPDKTHIEAFRDGGEAGPRSGRPGCLPPGCCVSQNMRSFGGSFGLLDAMRVGPDTGAGQIGAPHASRLWFSMAACGGTIPIASPSAPACRWNRPGSMPR